jgi:osmoprotectant transport system permease protein
LPKTTMEALTTLLSFTWDVREELLTLIGQHLMMSWIAVILGALAAIPLGVFVSRRPWLGTPMLDIVSMLYTIPSLALLGFLVPFMGLGWVPTITALVVYSLLPLLRNTYVGISEVDVFVKEAATGMGATKSQIFWQVELPMALPVIMAGLRTVAVLTVGITTMGALVGAGGLGVFVFRGIQMMDNNYLLAGTFPVAIIALSFDQLLGYAEKKLRVIMGVGGTTV